MKSASSSLGDRYAEITVVLVTLAALLAGWFYKSGVENSSIPFSAEGVSADAPKGWLQFETDGNEILRVTDLGSSGFGTTYAVRRMPVAAEASSAEVANLLAFEYAQNLLAFRVLNQQDVNVYGRSAYELSYVFVESNPDLTHTQFPRVVRGTDYVFKSGEFAVVVSFQADERNYDLDLDRFHLFLKSIRF
jgi:hypothetical protein